MRERWDRFAKTDPHAYALNLGPGVPREEVLAHGRGMVAWAMEWMRPARRGRMLEIGCGVGRTAVNWCELFERVDAADISPQMLETVRANNPPANLRLVLIDGVSLRGIESGVYDAVYCYVVFQHIPDGAVVLGYVDEVARVLAPGGRALLQYDTRPQGLLVRLYKSLPDALLPRKHRRFIRRYRRDAAELRRAFARAGLKVVEERGQGTHEHFFLLEKPGADATGAAAGT